MLMKTVLFYHHQLKTKYKIVIFINWRDILLLLKTEYN